MIKFSKDKVLLLHKLIAQETGGSIGVRDEGLLESALEAAFSGFGDKEFYPTKQLKTNQLHIDLDRAAALPGYCQFFACFTTPFEKLPPRMTVHDVFERELNAIVNEVNRNPDQIRQAFTPEEIEQNLKDGIIRHSTTRQPANTL